MNSSYFRNDIIVVNCLDSNSYLLTKDMIYDVLKNEKLNHMEIDQNLGIGCGMTIYNDNVYGIKDDIDIRDHVDIIIKILKKDT